MSEIKIAFIGAGNMATAIINGIIKSGSAKEQNIFIYDKLQDKMEVFEKQGMQICKSIGDAAQKAEYIFLAIKPQNYPEALPELIPYCKSGKVIITIAAGISSEYIMTALGYKCKVIRVMPNTPLLLGYGATAMCASEMITEEELNIVSNIFKSCGIVEYIPETLMNAVICVNGSSPAYVYLLAKAMLESAIKQGIDIEAAQRLINQTILGSAKMLIESGKSAQQLIDMVASPGGTTLASLQSFEQQNFEDIIDNAMKACTERAHELAK